jgi:multidrug efflux pump
VLSTGAGSEMRHAMGIAVFFGMLGVTLFGLMLTPVFYVVLRTLAGGKIHVAKKDSTDDMDDSGSDARALSHSDA